MAAPRCARRILPVRQAAAHGKMALQLGPGRTPRRGATSCVSGRTGVNCLVAAPSAPGQITQSGVTPDEQPMLLVRQAAAHGKMALQLGPWRAAPSADPPRLRPHRPQLLVIEGRTLASRFVKLAFCETLVRVRFGCGESCFVCPV